MDSSSASSGELTGTLAQGSSDSGSGEWVPSDDQPVLLTPAAVERVKHAIAADGEPGDGLRVSVRGGGCSGYTYSLDFEKDERMGDIVMRFDGVKIIVDPVSAGYLRGTIIDYVASLQGEGFKFNNPNAKRTCGCGHSFS